MSISISPVRTIYNRSGLPTYVVEMSHGGLHKHRIIKGTDPDFVQRKVSLQMADWEEQWSRKSSQQAKLNQAAQKKLAQEGQKSFAAERTLEAQKVLESLRNALQPTLSHNDAIDWESLKDNSPFPTPSPRKPRLPSAPPPQTLPHEPTFNDPTYKVKLGFLDKLITSRREGKVSEAFQLLKRDHKIWEQEVLKITTGNEARLKEYEQNVRIAEAAFQHSLNVWTKEQTAYLEKQYEQNASVVQQREQYLSGSSDALIAYCDLVLSRSKYPDFFPQEFELEYNSETKVLIVDYTLPAPEYIPTLLEVKYVAARDEFVEKHLTEPQRDKLYDDLLYQITLRTIHELFEADVIKAIAAIGFNGRICSIDKGTGQKVEACVLSIQAKCQDFLAINLANVDPKVCFKQLKGVGSSKLHSLTPVAPIMQMRRDDGRFVSSHDVAYQLNDGYNLAAMDWEEFEHLIREVFAKEFSSGGGEVRVTQASRDGGVDAIAFDPDPIRGGKIVIQAKRYTNTVGVAAVRDLYGTLMNEGATKGILVTTSDYGPDAYDFASNKPLTLLNGANLLHLLEKHGHKARIDLQEARRLALEQK